MKQKFIDYYTTSYNTSIELPYGKLGNIITWCQNNCERDWHFQVLNEAGNNPGKYSFMFDSEKDYINYLVWKK